MAPAFFAGKGDILPSSRLMLALLALDITVTDPSSTPTSAAFRISMPHRTSEKPVVKEYATGIRRRPRFMVATLPLGRNTTFTFVLKVDTCTHGSRQKYV